MSKGREPRTQTDPVRLLKQRKIDNIKMYLQEIGWVSMGVIGLVQNRDKLQAVVKTAMNIRVP
jgi:hypothetical protein